MLYTILFASIVVLAAFTARIVMIIVSPKKFDNWRIPLLCFSAGTFLGLVFFDLLPETFEAMGGLAPYWIMAGIFIFFVFEKFVFGYHHGLADMEKDHGQPGHIHPSGPLILVTRGLHNFLDGVAIAVAFAVSVPVGIITSLSVLAHEIPQEIGDIMVLLNSGFSRTKAFVWNFIFASTTLLAVFLTYYFLSSLQVILPKMLAITTGAFLYISMSDLLPETKHSESIKSGAFHAFLFLIGVLIIVTVGHLLPE